MTLDSLTRAGLDGLLAEKAARLARLRQTEAVATRLLELSALVPDAKTPSEAPADLGLSAEEWLEGQV